MPTPRAGLRGLTLALTAVILVAAACHSPTVPGINSPCPSTPEPAAGIDMSATDSTLVVGDTVRGFAFAGNGRGGLILCPASIQVASSDAGVAIVASDGLVTAMSAGTAYIRASSGTARDSLPIEVVAAAVASIATR